MKNNLEEQLRMANFNSFLELLTLLHCQTYLRSKLYQSTSKRHLVFTSHSIRYSNINAAIYRPIKMLMVKFRFYLTEKKCFSSACATLLPVSIPFLSIKLPPEVSGEPSEKFKESNPNKTFHCTKREKETAFQLTGPVNAWCTRLKI